MSELVRNMQEWRSVSLIPSELIDEVKELVRKNTTLEAERAMDAEIIIEQGAKLEAMERAWATDRAILKNYEAIEAAAQEEQE